MAPHLGVAHALALTRAKTTHVIFRDSRLNDTAPTNQTARTVNHIHDFSFVWRSAQRPTKPNNHTEKAQPDEPGLRQDSEWHIVNDRCMPVTG